MVEFLPFYFFYLLLFQLSSVDMYISTLKFSILLILRKGREENQGLYPPTKPMSACVIQPKPIFNPTTYCFY